MLTLHEIISTRVGTRASTRRGKRLDTLKGPTPHSEKVFTRFSDSTPIKGQADFTYPPKIGIRALDGDLFQFQQRVSGEIARCKTVEELDRYIAKVSEPLCATLNAMIQTQRRVPHFIVGSWNCTALIKERLISLLEGHSRAQNFLGDGCYSQFALTSATAVLHPLNGESLEARQSFAYRLHAILRRPVNPVVEMWENKAARAFVSAVRPLLAQSLRRNWTGETALSLFRSTFTAFGDAFSVALPPTPDHYDEVLAVLDEQQRQNGTPIRPHYSLSTGHACVDTWGATVNRSGCKQVHAIRLTTAVGLDYCKIALSFDPAAHIGTFIDFFGPEEVRDYEGKRLRLLQAIEQICTTPRENENLPYYMETVSHDLPRDSVWVDRKVIEPLLRF